MSVIKEHGIYFLTGTLRSGKGLTAVSKLREHILDGRRVVTNMDLKLENLLPADMKKVDVQRIPDKPNIDDFENIGLGYYHEDSEHYDESKFGLLVLDELATFFNSRTWNDKGRKKIIDWLLMSGKKRWILMMTIQDLSLLDKQIKASLASQFIVHCKSLSKYSIPILSPIYKLLFGRPLTLPKAYLAVVRVGAESHAPISDRWLHRGDSLYLGYNTSQVYLERDNTNAIQLSSYLSPWHLKGRYLQKKDIHFYRKLLSSRIEYFAYSIVFLFFLSSSAFIYSITSDFYSSNDKKLVFLQKKLDFNSVLIRKISSSSISNKNIAVSNDKCEDDKGRFDGFRIIQSYSMPSGFKYIISNGELELRTIDFNFSNSLLLSKGRCSFTLKLGSCKFDFSCNDPIAPTVVHAVFDSGGDRVVKDDSNILDSIF